MMQWSNLTKFFYLFNIVSPAVHTLLSACSVAVLGILWYRSSHPDPQKKSSTADNDLIISPVLLLSQVVVFHVKEQK